MPSVIDSLLVQADTALRTLFAPATAASPSPAQRVPEADLSTQERAHAAGLMRVNHAGEVCAQALYQGQAFAANDDAVRTHMLDAAREEAAHLAWSEARIKELGGRTSVLNPLWYAGSFALGALAGRAGPRWNLGFVMETERQVEQHLEGHLQQLPPSDDKSRAVLERMKMDEIRHGHAAQAMGGHPLPLPVRLAMKAVSKVMTVGAYRI